MDAGRGPRVRGVAWMRGVGRVSQGAVGPRALEHKFQEEIDE